MDVGLRTPLLDFFRRGDAARDARLLAAQGVLAPRALEQVVLLVFLTGDPDPDIARTAETTLAAIPRGSLASLLARADTPGEVRTFFAARGIEPAAVPPAPDDEPLVDAAPAVAPVEAEGPASALQRLSALNVAQRIGVAMKGSREERAILIRDPNKIVAVAVLSSPKMTDTEVEGFARMGSVSDEVLRIIANNRAWAKHYPVVLALVKNAKTPLAISMHLLSRLNERDLRMLSSDRNVPDALRITARKRVVVEK